MLGPVLDSSVQEWYGPLGTSPTSNTGLWRWLRDQSTWRTRKGWEIHNCSAQGFLSRCINLWWEGMRKRQPGSSQQCPVIGQEDWNSWNSTCSQLKTFFYCESAQRLNDSMKFNVFTFIHRSSPGIPSRKPDCRFNYKTFSQEKNSLHNSSQYSDFMYFLHKDFTQYFISNCIYETIKI